MQLGQTINGLLQQRRLIVSEAVPLWIRRGIFQSVGGRQVDHTSNFAHKCWGQSQTRFMRQTQECDIDAIDLLSQCLGV